MIKWFNYDSVQHGYKIFGFFKSSPSQEETINIEGRHTEGVIFIYNKTN